MVNRKKELTELIKQWNNLMKTVWIKTTPEKKEKMRILWEEMERVKEIIKMDKKYDI